MKTIKLGEPFRIEGEDRLGMFVRHTDQPFARLVRYQGHRHYSGRAKKPQRRG